MTQALLATDVGPVRRRAGRGGRHRGSVPGRGRRRAGRRRLRAAAAVVDPRDAATGRRRCCFPAPAPTSPVTFGEEPDPHLFDDCEVVVTRTIVNQRVAPAPMETRAAAAVWGEDGRLTAWIPNQGAQGTRAALARDARPRPDRMRVITPDVGGAFGAKFGADPRARGGRLGGPAARAARRAGPRPATRTCSAMTHGRAPGPDRHDRRQPGRPGVRLPAGGPAGLRRLPEDRRAAARR